MDDRIVSEKVLQRYDRMLRSREYRNAKENDPMPVIVKPRKNATMIGLGIKMIDQFRDADIAIVEKVIAILSKNLTVDDWFDLVESINNGTYLEEHIHDYYSNLEIS